MYLSVPGPAPPPPPAWYCKLLNLGCPAPQAQNPDSLASLYPGLQNEIATPGDVAGSTNSSTVQGLAGLGCAAGQPCKCGGKCKRHGMGQADDTDTTATLSFPFLDTSSSVIPDWVLPVAVGVMGLWAIYGMKKVGDVVERKYPLGPKRRRRRRRKS
jgi:hypothetical protein